jgi:hypothetical protein
MVTMVTTVITIVSNLKEKNITLLGGVCYHGLLTVITRSSSDTEADVL